MNRATSDIERARIGLFGAFIRPRSNQREGENGQSLQQLNFMDLFFIEEPNLRTEVSIFSCSREFLGRDEDLTVNSIDEPEEGAEAVAVAGAEAVAEAESGQEEEEPESEPVPVPEQRLEQPSIMAIGYSSEDEDLLENETMPELFEDNESLVESPIQNLKFLHIQQALVRIADADNCGLADIEDKNYKFADISTQTENEFSQLFWFVSQFREYICKILVSKFVVILLGIVITFGIIIIGTM